MKKEQFRQLSADDLIQKEKAFKKELFDLSYQRKMGQVEKPSRFRLLKRNIARILTIARENEIAEKNKNATK